MDPNRDFYRHGANAGMGIFQAFVPTGAVGIFAGVFILVLLGVVTGMFQGVWLVVAGLSLVGLAGLTVRALRREIRREDRHRPRGRQSSLPSDADISEAERREAMRRHADDTSKDA